MSLEVKRVDSDQEAEAVRLLRIRVFVDEQGVSPEVEIDKYDPLYGDLSIDTVIHAVAYTSGIVVGTGRLILDMPENARIGRMAVEASLRRSGVGSELLAFLENEARSQGVKQVTLHAQNHAKGFYAKYGYMECGETFLEAGILHIEMKKHIL